MGHQGSPSVLLHHSFEGASSEGIHPGLGCPQQFCASQRPPGLTHIRFGVPPCTPSLVLWHRDSQGERVMLWQWCGPRQQGLRWSWVLVAELEHHGKRGIGAAVAVPRWGPQRGRLVAPGTVPKPPWWQGCI